METKLKHLVFVSREFRPSLNAGGIASYVKEAAESLVQNGVKVSVICASDDTRTACEYIENGVNVIRLSGGDFYVPQVEKNPFFIKRLRFAYRFFSYRLKIRHIIQDLEEVSVIEVAEYAAEGLFLLNLNIPLVVRLHTPYLLDRKTEDVRQFSFQNVHYYWVGLLEIFIMKKAKHVTSCSESLKRWMNEKKGISSHNITTIYNPLNVINWSPSPKKNSSKQPFTLFFSGRIQSEKGVEELIYAVKSIRAKGINIFLYLAGREGKISSDLRKEIEKENWDWCVFLGHLTREQLKEYYTKSTISCFPSWWENMPYTCLEAMALGAIIITSSNGGMLEVIIDGENGFLCPPLNVEALAQKIESVLSMENQKREKIAQNAIATIKNNFSTILIAKKNIDYYNALF